MKATTLLMGAGFAGAGAIGAWYLVDNFLIEGPLQTTDRDMVFDIERKPGLFSDWGDALELFGAGLGAISSLALFHSMRRKVG